MKIKRAGDKIWLSHSGLELLERCPRCFWLRYKMGIKQPEGITSRLPVRFDQIIKKYFNSYRAINEIPPLIKDKVVGKLENPFQETYFYPITQKYGFYGKLDECLIANDGKYTVVDFKTTSTDPNNNKEIYPSYQNQLDIYAFLLESKGKKSSGIGHLIYFYPECSEKLHEGFPVTVKVETIEVNPTAVMPRLLKAIEVLEGNCPAASSTCEFCQWHQEVSEIITNI
ncbi:hypothetical protein COT20_01765 [bacterium (Candidatus Gribaldobacteria) CG08_land_8_20_14_0_20_39_15]|uniref:PD-(D/E)XK endonuclease-like domain-containing protein n=1 Tax=bacterium (Candidatus Gribaldobacteria) CG08_land_8_20_14_0_20_39_15 TaxID=2014273 RepID=A0A2M6XUF8_9BACT|nr:MAG: hypothetical protein COT20_01765 [bacterium (Candidatus Gribaldobacteria) CG08_land_8_20_14_0_20_39_15]